jgi:hypothetical protein
MTPKNDPTLAVLLDGVSDDTERTAIISAYHTLGGAGATTFPGALSVLLARHTTVVVNAVNKVAPPGPLAANLQEVAGEFRHFREESVPRLEEKWSGVITAANRIRKYRLGLLIAYFLLIPALAYLGGFYTGFDCFCPTRHQSDLITRGETFDTEHITVNCRIKSDGSFIVNIDGDRPFTKKQDDTNEQGVPIGESILWPEPFPLQ